MPPETIGDGIKLTSAPQVFKLGDGTKSYGASDQVAAILSAASTAEKQAAELAARIKTADAQLPPQETAVRSLKARMDAALASGDTAGYNALVPEYNAAADAYNKAVTARNALVAEHNRYAELQTYIVKHLDDRRGVYSYVQAHPL